MQTGHACSDDAPGICSPHQHPIAPITRAALPGAAATDTLLSAPF